MSEIMRRAFINERWRRGVTRLVRSCLLIALVAAASCKRAEPPRAAYVPVAQLERTYGRLITVSNEPTPGQHGTGDRLGLFRDEGGTVWGIPLTIADDGGVMGCAPPALRAAPASDTLPADAAEIVGAANEPNGWRGGTGGLELMLRDARGVLRWHSVKAVEAKIEPMCMSQSPPVIPLKFYRLVKAGAGR
jgi:hypothetical protein